MGIKIESGKELTEYLNNNDWGPILPQAIIDFIREQSEVAIENLAEDEVKEIVENWFDSFRQWTSAITVPVDEMRSAIGK